MLDPVQRQRGLRFRDDFRAARLQVSVVARLCQCSHTLVSLWLSCRRAVPDEVARYATQMRSAVEGVAPPAWRPPERTARGASMEA